MPAHRSRFARRSSCLAGAIAVVAAVGLASEAHAQGVDSIRQRAADLYDAGIAAYLTGDFRAAGQAFLRANRLVPAAVALAQAVRSFQEARDVRAAGTLALQLGSRDGLPPGLHDAVERAIEDARRAYVRVDVDCDEPCAISVDGVVEESSRFFASPNRDLRISVAFETGAAPAQVVRAQAGEARLVSFAAPTNASPGGSSESTAVTEAAGASPAAVSDDADENPYRISSRSVFSRPRAAFFAVMSVAVAGGGVLAWAGLQVRDASYRLRLARATGTEVDIARADVNRQRDVERLRWFAVEEGGVLLAMTLIAIFTDFTPHGDGDAPRTTADVSASRAGAFVSVQHAF